MGVEKEKKVAEGLATEAAVSAIKGPLRPPRRDDLGLLDPYSFILQLFLPGVELGILKGKEWVRKLHLGICPLVAALPLCGSLLPSRNLIPANPKILCFPQGGAVAMFLALNLVSPYYLNTPKGKAWFNLEEKLLPFPLPSDAPGSGARQIPPVDTNGR